MPPHQTEEGQDRNLLSKELVLSSLVHEVTRVMHSAAAPEQAMRAFLLGAAELTGIGKMALLLLDAVENRLVPAYSIGLAEAEKERFRLSASGGAIAECLTSGRHILVEAPAPGDPLGAAGPAGYLIVPLAARYAEGAPEVPSCALPVGVLWLDASAPGAELTGQTIPYLAGLAQQASLLLETWRAHRELAAANQDLQRANARLNAANAALNEAQKIIGKDLDRARAIQNGLLPSSFPDHLLKRVASKYIPAGMVGGDYYDCFELPGGRLGLVVADVSGHGIGAALVMSMFKALLRTFSAGDASPCSVLNRINATLLAQNLGGAQFVTAFYGVFDKTARTLTYCNAGHVAQFLRHAPETRGGLLQEMPSHGLVLGMFADTFLTETTLSLPGPARLFLFTDGITEAHGPDGWMFGAAPLKRLAADPCAEHPAAVIDALMRARSEFLGGSVQAGGELADDATLVIIDL